MFITSSIQKYLYKTTKYYVGWSSSWHAIQHTNPVQAWMVVMCTCKLMQAHAKQQTSQHYSSNYSH